MGRLSQALGLSPREQQILQALTDGIKDAGIAQRLPARPIG
jgi:DNA-binding NarL/FixJ family response regulator